MERKDLPTSGLLLLWVEKKKTFFFFMVERTVNWMIHHCDNDIEWWWSILIVFDNHHHLVTTCFHVNAFPYRIRGRTFSGITTAEAEAANRLMFCKMTNESTCLLTTYFFFDFGSLFPHSLWKHTHTHHLSCDLLLFLLLLSFLLLCVQGNHPFHHPANVWISEFLFFFW